MGSQFPDQGSNAHRLHWRADSLLLDHEGSPSFQLFVFLLDVFGDCLDFIPNHQPVLQLGSSVEFFLWPSLLNFYAFSFSLESPAEVVAAW